MMQARFAPRWIRTSAAFATVIVAALAAPAAAQTSAPSMSAPVAKSGATPLSLAQTPAPMPQTQSADTLQLSMDQAVQMAMQTNLGIKSDRMSLDIAAQGIAGAKVSFLPTLTSQLNRTNSQSQPTDFTQGNSDISRQQLTSSSQFQQLLPWFGSAYSVNWSGQRATQVGGNSTFNPQLGTTLQLSFLQPLWRNLKIDPSRAALQTAERTRAITDTQLQQSIANTDVNVRGAYLNLVAAIQFRQVAQQNLDVGNEQLRGARARVDVGQSAPIDIIAAEAAAASLREQLIAAESNISSAEDSLRTLILDPSRPDFWTVHLVPTDDMQVVPKDLDAAAEDAAVKTALANRLDSSILKQNLQQVDLNMRIDQNLTKPQVNFQAIYTSVGTGGTLLQYGEGFPPPVVGRVDRSYGSALNDTFLGAYPTWQVGVNVAYPIGRTGAQISLATDEIRKNQQLTDLQNLELEIVREVRDSARQVRTAIQRMQAADNALQSSQKQADAKQQGFDVGLYGLFELQSAQQQLAGAKQAAVQARLNYIAALIRFDAVQKIRQ